MQLIHGVYNLQQNHEKDEWDSIWKASALLKGLNVEEFLNFTVPAPILTRWWTIGVCAKFLIKNYSLLLSVIDGVINRQKSHHAANKIASGVLGLVMTPQIISDVHLIANFHDFYLFPNF